MISSGNTSIVAGIKLFIPAYIIEGVAWASYSALSQNCKVARTVIRGSCDLLLEHMNRFYCCSSRGHISASPRSGSRGYCQT